MYKRDLKKEIERARETVREADALLITAGAGMGVDSGLPDFRGTEGFWRAYPIAKRLGLRFEELANPRWFEENPKLAWAFYGHRLNLYRNTEPHEGFYLLKKAGEQKKGKYFVFTSNVDGQFQKAGFEEKRVVEIHGSIHYLQCMLPCIDDIWSSDEVKIEIDMEKFEAKEPLPKCRYCGRIARPNILMFGDFNFIPYRTDLALRRLYEWLDFIDDMGYKLAIIEIGAGKAVPTVRYFSEDTARKYNGTLIRINPRDFDVPTEKDISLNLKGLEGIKAILDVK
ncbi:MAG: NAD-dependent deacetylase [Persephonella sp.]|nr:MAG: NAD-dependent deacetylase [Persephonella sp.]